MLEHYILGATEVSSGRPVGNLGITQKQRQGRYARLLYFQTTGRTLNTIYYARMYTLYILKCADGSLYTGIAKDVKKRLAVHRAGAGSKYVRTRLPVTVVYTEQCGNRSKATKREMEIKNMTHKEKIILCHPS